MATVSTRTDSSPSTLTRFFSSPLFWGALLLLGTAIRFRQYLFAHSYWYDEGFAVIPTRLRGFDAILGPQFYNLVIPRLTWRSCERCSLQPALANW